MEFHDASTHHALHIPNTSNYSKAALSTSALVLACESDDSFKSKLTCTHFGSWDSNKEWDVAMPEGESIECISISRSHIAVATDERLLRVLSISGTQLQLFTLPGPVVSLAMHDKQILLVYHSAGGFNECHSYGILQYRLRKTSWKVHSDSCFVAKQNFSLSWVGFSLEGTPTLHFTSGEVLLLHRTQMSWVPIANMRTITKHKSDTYWILGVEEVAKQIRCIYCKGARFPATLPRPMPVVVPFQIPLCEPTTEKSLKEEDLMKYNALSSNMNYNANTLHMEVEVQIQDVERQQIRLLMQLFALACKSDQEQRAVELCNLMPSADSIGMAIQYASKVRRMGLAQRLTEMAQKRATDVEEEEEEDVFAEEEEEEVSEGEDEYVEDAVVDASPEESSSFQSSGPRMAVIGRKANPFRASVDTIDDANETEDALFSSDTLKGVSESGKSTTIRYDTSGASNPFKSNKPKATSTRGTDLFETLSSESLNKKTKMKSSQQEPTKNMQKKSGVKNSEKAMKKKKTGAISFAPSGKKSTSDEKESANVKKTPDEKPQENKTGFQMYMSSLEQNSNEVDEENSENRIPEMMRKWKGLSAEEQKSWNEKAKSYNTGSSLTSSVLTPKQDSVMNEDEMEASEMCPEKEHEPVTKEKKMKKIVKPSDAKKINEVKSASRQKLAGFSFQKK